ncbi:MAG: rRNA maturation RNase YbeY [Rhodobacteraceae bacterium]|nr:rRNA maturation RNase YbeY [Paracoccaceae bacterium]
MIEVILEDERWAGAELEALATPAAGAAMAVSGRRMEGFEIALLGCDDSRIAALNADFRATPAPTNVLSWPAYDAPPIKGASPEIALGDIAIAFETCQREAVEKGISVHDHVTHLVIHGVLHLLGYDHISDTQAEEMEALEVKALAKLGINNPY